jgi:hypothetical protein
MFNVGDYVILNTSTYDRFGKKCLLGTEAIIVEVSDFDHDNYALYIKDFGPLAWVHGHELKLLEKNRWDKK